MTHRMQNSLFGLLVICCFFNSKVLLAEDIGVSHHLLNIDEPEILTEWVEFEDQFVETLNHSLPSLKPISPF